MHKTNKQYYRPQSQRLAANQSGAALIVGIVIIVVLVLAAAIVGYLILTSSKPTPVLQVETPKITADDKLYKGSSNNELVLNRMIIEAGLARDTQQRDGAQTVLNDEQLPVGDGVATGTVVETARLSQLQTDYIKESDRRLTALNASLPTVNKLNTDQRTLLSKTINDEITAITGLKTKAAAETTSDAFLADRDSLGKEYVNYLMAICQARMLLWANYQTALESEVNVLGGSFQDRINTASNNGDSTATAQTLLNSYQSNKTTSQSATASALKSLNELKPGTFNSNKAVVQQYFNQLATANNELTKANDTAKQLVSAVKLFKH